MNRRDVLLAGVAVMPGLLRGALASAGTAAGTRVVVTKEMLGAGVVQSASRSRRFRR